MGGKKSSYYVYFKAACIMLTLVFSAAGIIFSPPLIAKYITTDGSITVQTTVDTINSFQNLLFYFGFVLFVVSVYLFSEKHKEFIRKHKVLFSTILILFLVFSLIFINSLYFDKVIIKDGYSYFKVKYGTLFANKVKYAITPGYGEFCLNKKPVFNLSFAKTEKTEEYPTRKDYMRILQRYPAYAERGYSELCKDGSVGFFGSGKSEESGMRTLSNFIFTYSLLASDPGYDSTESGISREIVEEHALASIRYMAGCHVTGKYKCVDGTKWGNDWQSSWWTAKLAAGSSLIWDSLTDYEKKAVERVIVYEADRLLSRKAESGLIENTKAEENSWNSEILSFAYSMFPGNKNSEKWNEKAKELMINSITVQSDAENSEKIYTVNAHDDFTIENHGAYHPGYVASTLLSLTWSFYGYNIGNNEAPKETFHHYYDAWNQLKKTYIFDNRPVYFASEDWPRLGYALYFMMPPLALIQNKFIDSDARLIESKMFEFYENEQLYNQDGGFFSKRFTNNRLDRFFPEFETDLYALLGLSYILHGENYILPTELSQFYSNVSGAHISPGSEFIYSRDEDSLASFSWRTLWGEDALAILTPLDSANTGYLIEWAPKNLIGGFKVKGYEQRILKEPKKIIHTEEITKHGFVTTGLIPEGLDRNDNSYALNHYVSFIYLNDENLAAVFDYAVANKDITITEKSALDFNFINDYFNSNTRTIYSDEGKQEIRGTGGEESQITITSDWVNVDNKIGIVSKNRGAFTILDRSERNAPYNSILFETLYFDYSDIEQDYASSETIRDFFFLLHTGGTDKTQIINQAPNLNLKTGDKMIKARLIESGGSYFLIVTNFNQNAQKANLYIPPDQNNLLIFPVNSFVNSTGTYVDILINGLSAKSIKLKTLIENKETLNLATFLDNDSFEIYDLTKPLNNVS